MASRISTLFITATIFLCNISTGCCQKTDCMKTKYFESPQIAVELITIMLKDKNWKELTKHYDLTNSDTEPKPLKSGDFFYTEERPESAHPAGFWKYKHPFAPGFKYDSVRDVTEEPGIVEVTISIEIDQGGGMIQRGYNTFLMRKSDLGYQVLPDNTLAD